MLTGSVGLAEYYLILRDEEAGTEYDICSIHSSSTVNRFPSQIFSFHFQHVLRGVHVVHAMFANNQGLEPIVVGTSTHRLRTFYIFIKSNDSD